MTSNWRRKVPGSVFKIINVQLVIRALVWTLLLLSLCDHFERVCVVLRVLLRENLAQNTLISTPKLAIRSKPRSALLGRAVNVACGVVVTFGGLLKGVVLVC